MNDIIYYLNSRVVVNTSCPKLQLTLNKSIMKNTIKKYSYNWILFVLTVFMFVQCNTANQYTVKLKDDCVLNIESRFDTSAVAIKEIESGLTKIMTRIQGLIPADSLTINVRLAEGESRKFIVPQMGVGGKAEDEYIITLLIEPDNTNFKFEHLYHVLAHEIHHSIRARHVGKWATLLDAFIFEGLAPLFQMEVLGGERPFFTKCLDNEEMAKYLKMSESFLYKKIDLKNKEDLYYQWFFGSGEDNKLPPGAGYSIGWQLIQNYIKIHPEATASSLIFVPAEEIASATFDAKVLDKI